MPNFTIESNLADEANLFYDNAPWTGNAALVDLVSWKVPSASKKNQINAKMSVWNSHMWNGVLSISTLKFLKVCAQFFSLG